MRIGRKAIALTLVGASVSLAMLNLGGTAGAAAWSVYKMSASSGGSEPGLETGVDANGDPIMYVHGTYGIPTHNKAWVRKGNGAFTPIAFSAPYNRLPGGGDAEMALKGDDVWFIDLWAGSNSIQYSPDRGTTWVSGTPFTTLPLSDRQWIEVGPTRINPVTNARETTVYATYQKIGTGGTWIARSRDNGLTWDFHNTIQEGPVGIGTSGIPIDVAYGEKNGVSTLAVAMISGGQMVLAVSHDEGATWDVNSTSGSAKDAAGSLTGFAMNPDDPDEMAVSYQASGRALDGGVPNKTVVRLTHDGGATWSDMIRLDPAAPIVGPVDWFPWIDWRGDKIAVAWYQSNEYIPQRDSNQGNPLTTKWDVWYSESTDDGATFSTPEPIGTGPVKKGGICTNGLGCDQDRELGDFLNVAIDVDGRSWVTFVNVNSTVLPGGGIYVLGQPTS